MAGGQCRREEFTDEQICSPRHSLTKMALVQVVREEACVRLTVQPCHGVGIGEAEDKDRENKRRQG